MQPVSIQLRVCGELMLSAMLLAGTLAAQTPSHQALQTRSAGGDKGKLRSNPRAFPVRLSAPKQGRKITNPKASLQDATIIAILQKQRSAADAEAAQMKLAIRPAGVQ